ncbi:unnamed protein product, partial [Polarella glacialis]
MPQSRPIRAEDLVAKVSEVEVLLHSLQELTTEQATPSSSSSSARAAKDSTVSDGRKSARLLVQSYWALLASAEGGALGEADVRHRIARCLGGLRSVRAALPLKAFQLEAIWLETGSLMERHRDWRLAWELTFGLVRHLALGPAAEGDTSPRSNSAAHSLLAHASLRASTVAASADAASRPTADELAELCCQL